MLLSKLTTIFIVCTLVFLSGCNNTRTDSLPLTEKELREIEIENGKLGLYKNLSKNLASIYDKNELSFHAKYITLFDKLATNDIIEASIDKGSNVEQVLDSANILMHLSGSSFVLGPLWLSFMSSPDPKKIAAQRNYDSMKKPNIQFRYLYEGEIDTPAFYELLEGHEKLLDSFPFRCINSIGYTNWKTREGFYGNDSVYFRKYHCIMENDEFRSELITIPVRDGGSYDIAPFNSASLLAFTNNFYLPDIYGKKDKNQAKDLYYEIKDSIPDNAYTVFTGFDDKNKWKVFVAHQGKVLSFDPPK